MDTMHISSEAFLVTVDKTIKYRGCESIRGQSDNDHYTALDKMLKVYNATGFTINIFECNGFYKSMMEKIKDSMNIRMN